MENGFSKWLSIALILLAGIAGVNAENHVKATALTHDIKDLSQRSSKIYDQNGERCALIRFETPIPSYFSFNLGAQQVEKRENKDDEVWIWVSADVKKMTIRCSECSPLKDYRVSLKAGNVYRAKLTTGLPQEVATTQNVNIYCERIPFYISIDGSEPVLNAGRNYYTELPIGAHEINVSSKMYKPLSKTIRVYRSRPYMDTIRLEDYSGEVLLTATQSSYSVYVDDELQKQNKRFKLEPGMHKLVIKKDRYETFETQVEVKLNEQTSVYAALKPAFSIFTVTAADDDTEIWIDDEYKGRGKANVEIVWGEHSVQGRRPGYDTFEFPIHDFTANSEKAIKIPKLNKQYGSLHLSVTPKEAFVMLDGIPIETTDGVYNVARYPTGTHYVQIRMTDYSPVRDSFTVVSGQLSTHEYLLTPIPLGQITIHTESEIGIYLVVKDGEPIFLGHTDFHGKLPAGENVIELRNLDGVKCYYRIYLNDKEIHDPVTLPFKRELMIRKNIAGGTIKLKGPQQPEYQIKANKKIKLLPYPYALTVEKKGYITYKDTIDLSVTNSKSLIYRANVRRVGDTLQTNKSGYKSPAFLQRFYDNAGKWFIGIIDFGYSFDFNGGNGYRHQVHLGVLPFRYRMLGVNPADFEVTVNDGNIFKTLCYRPRLSLVLPCNHGFAFTFYGGASVNINDWYNKVEKIRTHLLGGVTMRFNYSGRFPMDLFAEYKYPVQGVDKSTIGKYEQLFRVGVIFTGGIDL